MAKYETDLRDLYFNLFEFYQTQDHNPEMGEEDLKEIIRQFDNFVESEIFPTREAGDQIGVKLENGKVTTPDVFKRAMQQFHENGWYALGVEEEYGGMPASSAIEIACTSLMAGANVALAMYPGLTKGAMNVIKHVGSKEQKDTFMPNMMEGKWGGTMCLTEPGAGSDVGNAKTTATAIGDGKYKISGTKIFISSGDNDLYDNIIHLVLARTPEAEAGVKGLSLFIVPKNKLEDGKFNNVTCSKIEEKMGIHGSSTCELLFGNEGECIGELIGQEGDGINNMFIMMNEARLLCGLQGESQGCLAYLMAKKYAGERVQFGTEIINTPDVKRMLLKMRALSRGMRCLALYTANLFDAVKSGKKELESEIALLTPVCKSFMSEEGFNIAVDAIQVHGGYGFCTEYGVEQFARDTKIASIYEGTNGIQAIDFVHRKILKDEAKTYQSVANKILRVIDDTAGALYPKESEMLETCVNDSRKIIRHYFQLAGEKKFNDILATAKDFLDFSGNLFVASLLLKSALIAHEKMSNAQGDDKNYYQTKIDDFKIFCQHYLVRNLAIASTILHFNTNQEELKLY